MPSARAYVWKQTDKDSNRNEVLFPHDETTRERDDVENELRHAHEERLERKFSPRRIMSRVKLAANARSSTIYEPTDIAIARNKICIMLLDKHLSHTTTAQHHSLDFKKNVKTSNYYSDTNLSAVMKRTERDEMEMQMT